MFRNLVKIYIQIVLTLGVISSAQAVTITYVDGGKEAGRVGEISETGFQFFGERFVFLEYDRVIDIDVDSRLTGAEFDKENKAVKKISLLLDKEKKLDNKLGYQVRKWLEEGKYDELDSKAAELNRTNARWATGRWQIYSFYQQVTGDLSLKDFAEYNRRIEQINAWIQEKPGSVTAKISLMKALTGLAWAHRGSGYNNTVTDSGRKKFRAALKKVIEIGSKLRADKATDLMLYNYLINAENAMGAEKSFLIELAKESSTINPQFYLPYIRTLTSLLPKWGGKPGAAEEFSRWAYQLVDKKSPEVVFQTHRALKRSDRDKTYARMNFDWATIKRSFENFRKTYHANDSDFHLMVKLACLHGDKEAALAYFAQTDGSWNYLSKRVWGKEAKLDRFLNWANTTESLEHKQIVEAFLRDNFKSFSDLIESVKQIRAVFFEKDIFGNTMLHNLAERNAPEYLDKISSVGINLDVYNDYGYTALHLAASSGRSQNVKILLKNGVDIFITRHDKRNNAAHMAAEKGFEDVLSILLDKAPSLIATKGHNGSSPLHLAAWDGYLDTVRFLVGKSTNELNMQDDYQYTPLHYAIDRGYEEIVRFLVEQGADPGLKNNKGHTALSFARAKRFNQIASYLKGIDAPDAQVEDNSANIKKAEEIYELSGQYFNKKDYEKAKEIYFKALEYYPDYYLAYAGLAQVAFDFEKDYIQADKYYDKSIELNPRFLENYYWKGRVNFELNRPEIYKPLFTKYVEVAPDTYNSKDLKANWPHLLNDNNSLNREGDLVSRFIKLVRENLNLIAAGLGILVLLMLLLRFRTRNS